MEKTKQVWVCRDCKTEIKNPTYRNFVIHTEETGHPVFAPLQELVVVEVVAK